MSVSANTCIQWSSLKKPLAHVQAADSHLNSLPPLPGAKRKFNVESQYKIVNGRMLGQVPPYLCLCVPDGCQSTDWSAERVALHLNVEVSLATSHVARAPSTTF
jgi:hypothetical protein